VDASGNDGNASMPERVKRPNPWRKIMMMMTMTNIRCCNHAVIMQFPSSSPFFLTVTSKYIPQHPFLVECMLFLHCF